MNEEKFIKIPHSKFLSKKLNCNFNTHNDKKSPFFWIRNKKETINSFVDAVNSNKYDTALGLISKKVTSIDLDEINDIFKNKIINKCIPIYKSNGVKGFVSIALSDKKNQKSEIIHIKMIKEPNKLGEWKIYEIIRE